MYRGQLQFGDTEVVNHNRLFAYLTESGPPGLDVLYLDRWKWQARWMGHAPYRTPRLDNAPWYSPTVDASEEFLGLHLRAYTGVDDVPWSREAAESISDGGAHGLGRYSTKRIELKLTAYGSTHSGLMYGLQWLDRVLTQPVCDDRDATVSLRYLTTVPRIAPDTSPSTATLIDCTNPHRRILHDVAATTGHTIDRWWVSDHTYDTGEHMAADLTVVLAAADPFAYHDALLDLAGPIGWAGRPTQTVTWQLVGLDGTCGTPASGALLNPNAPVLSPVRRPAVAAPNRICQPLYYRTTTTTLALAVDPTAKSTTLTVVVQAGATDLENVRIRITDTTTERAVGEIGVSYLPAGARLTIDGTTGTAIALLSSGDTVDASAVVSAGTLGPLTSVRLSCLRTYRLDATAPDDVASGASVSILGTTAWAV